MKELNLLIAFSVSVLVLFGLAGTAAAAPACSQATSFKVLSVQWGNASTLISAGPGMNDTPLYITLEAYGGSCELQGLSGKLELSGGISGLNGNDTPTDTIASVQPYQIFNMVYNLNIRSNLTAGPNVYFSYPLVLSWYYPNNTVSTNQTYNINVPLKGSAALQYSLKTVSIPSGESYSEVLEVRNNGTGTLTNINTKITASGVSILSQPGKIPSLAPGESANVTFVLYSAHSPQSSAVGFQIESNYLSPYGYNSTSSYTLYGILTPITTADIFLSASTENLYAGETQAVNMIVENGEPVPIYNVSVTLSPQSPISILQC